MNKEELQLLKETLEEAFRADNGSGHWLPEKHMKDMRKCINLVKRELAIPRIQVTKLEDRTTITKPDGSITTFYDDDNLQ